MTAEQKARWRRTSKEREGQLRTAQGLERRFNVGMTAMAAAAQPTTPAEREKGYERRFQALTKASEIGPTELAVWANLRTLHEAGEHQDRCGSSTPPRRRAGCYGKAIALKPEDAATHNNYALALVQAKKIPTPGRTDQGRATRPGQCPQVYYNLGAVLTNGQSERKAAVEAFKRPSPPIRTTPTPIINMASPWF